MKGSLFSESWYKVANIKVSLLDAVDVQKQFYRGELWYVLKDRFNNSHFKVTAEAYRFIVMLETDKTINEVWEECIAEYDDSAPTQDEVISLLSQLHINNLLNYKNQPNNEFIYERQSEKRKKELKNKIISLMSIKIPLWNPDKFLNIVAPFLNGIVSNKGLMVWLLVVVSGIKATIDNRHLIYDNTQGMLAPSRLFYLYIALALLKLLHEMGHAIMTKRFGGAVHTVGVMFLVFTPLPYMDATSSWFFQSRWQRMLVGSAGMLVDFFCAAVAALIWSQTGDGLLHTVAFNVMIVASISSFVFNANPLIRFDAYYILSDFLEIPNLAQRSRQQWIYWIEKYLFAVEHSVSPSLSHKEAFWLSLYAVTSFLYRAFIAVVIVLFIADKFLGIGLLLAILSIAVATILPAKSLVTYLAKNPNLVRSRKRAISVSALVLLVIIIMVTLIPFPYAIRAPVVVEAKEFSKVYATTEGVLHKLSFKNGDHISKGDVIALLSNIDLESEIATVKAGMLQNMALKQRAMSEANDDLKPLAVREQMLRDQLRHLEQKKAGMSIVAENTGVFVAPDAGAFMGRWLKRQTRLGSIISSGNFKCSAIVSQEQAFDLFKEKNLAASIKLYGSNTEKLKVHDIVVIPYQKEELPSAALGWFGGGDVSVSSSDKSGTKTIEPFFEVIGTIEYGTTASAKLLHGRSGVLRMKLPSVPLSVQLYRLVKQTIQKRYKV
ncbi:MAG: biotin/lipoyl-binding protein [Deltaproteobacteria bacterium]|nr:biotin/lipoyl-binding protein [Deltaproteobacteria bacterium]